MIPALIASQITALVLAGATVAYIGPGGGLSAIGALLALVAATAIAMVGFIWYPLKRLRRKLKKNVDPSQDAGSRPESIQARPPTEKEDG